MQETISKDSLGDRMKAYENITRQYLSPNSYTIARIDGHSFHTYTKGLKRPFDIGLTEDMDSTAAYLCSKIQNARFAFVQSDEISIFIKEKNPESNSWFNYNLQKIASISAGIATAEFNKLRLNREFKSYMNTRNEMISQNQNPKDFTEGSFNDIIAFAKQATFDSRFWTVPNEEEVINYFIWRQQDATKNSISSVAYTLYSPKELEGVNSNDRQELIFQKGINWNDYPSGLKRGRFIKKNYYLNDQLVDEVNKEDLTEDDVLRTRWETIECPVFSKDKDFLRKLLK